MASSDKSTWSIWGFYKKSWKLTWTHKKLWILGVAVMVFTSNGGSSSSSNDRDEDRDNSYQVEAQTVSPETQEPFTEEDLRMLFNEGNLGSEQFIKEIDPFEQPPFSSLRDGFVQVPLVIKTLAVIEIIVLFIGVIVLAAISSAWAMGALMTGVLAATRDKLGTLAQVTRESFKYIKPLIWVAIVPALLFFLLSLVVIVIFTILLGILINVVPFIGILATIGFIIFAVYVVIRFIAAVVWASRFVVNNKLSGREAFKQGNALGKHTYWRVLRLGTVNLILALLIYAIIFAPALVLGVKELSAEVINTTNLIPAAILFILALPLSALATAIYHVFSFATFQYAFDSVTDMKEKE